MTRWVMVFCLLLASPAWAGLMRRTTYEGKVLGRRHTVCADGTRAVSAYHKTLGRWETAITASPKTSCAGQMHPRTQQVEVRCR